MAQIVHDLAPGANVDFATAFTGELGFASNIRRLAAAGAPQVIADDVAYFDEPFFQDGPIAVAVNEVTAAGVSYFSSAGNDNLIDSAGRDIASWEAPAFRDADLSAGPGHCRRNGTLHGLQPRPGLRPHLRHHRRQRRDSDLDLQWAEPWYGVQTDLDAFLLDSEGKPLEVQGDDGKVALRRRRRQPQQPEAGRGSRVGKRHRSQRGSQTGDQSLLRGLQPGGERDDLAATQVRSAAERRRCHRDRVPAILRRGRRRADRLRPCGGRGGDRGRRGPLQRRLQAGALLLARSGQALLRPGCQRFARAGDRRAGHPQARSRRHRLRRDKLLRQTRSRRLALLRHLGRGAARGGGRGPRPPGQSRGDASRFVRR